MSRNPKPKPAAAGITPNAAEAQAPAAHDPAKALPQVAPDPTGDAPASAAAAAAPVDPKPQSEEKVPAKAAANMPTDKGFILRVKGPAKGRWRAGRHFGPEAIDIPADELSEEDMQKLHGDPELTVLVLGEH